jgi:hypothetical protein
MRFYIIRNLDDDSVVWVGAHWRDTYITFRELQACGYRLRITGIEYA